MSFFTPFPVLLPMSSKNILPYMYVKLSTIQSIFKKQSNLNKATFLLRLFNSPG